MKPGRVISWCIAIVVAAITLLVVVGMGRAIIEVIMK